MVILLSAFIKSLVLQAKSIKVFAFMLKTVLLSANRPSSSLCEEQITFFRGCGVARYHNGLFKLPRRKDEFHSKWRKEILDHIACVLL